MDFDVGECIYCGDTKPPLTREHILPRGLGGELSPVALHQALVLRQASCSRCQLRHAKDRATVSQGYGSRARATRTQEEGS